MSNLTAQQIYEKTRGSKTKEKIEAKNIADFKHIKHESKSKEKKKDMAKKMGKKEKQSNSKKYSEMNETEKAIHTGAMKSLEGSHPHIYKQMNRQKRGY